jgi:hypothetical protein
MSLTIYFLRHGETPFSREDILSGAMSDPELTLEGQWMAVKFRSRRYTPARCVERDQRQLQSVKHSEFTPT